MRDTTDQTRPARARRACPLAVAALATVVLVAGCGGSAASRTATSAAGPGLAGSDVTFSKCMRANGVPSFPDLRGNGMLIEGGGQTVSVNGVSVNAPAFQAARDACDKYLPHPRVAATSAQAAQARQRGLEFAKCMRSHGVPSFPDPKVISSSGNSQRVYLPGVNPQSPAFQAGARACGGGPKGP